MNKRRRRFGDRADGYRIRTLPPMNTVAPYIMKKRSDACNFIHESVAIEKVEEYILKKRSEGLKGFGLLHVMIAAYVRLVSQRPGINRFISGQKIYHRYSIEVMLMIKREMRLDAEETCVKMEFEPDATAEQIFERFQKLIDESRSGDESSNFDNAARIINLIPGLFKKFTVWLLNFMDYFGLLPRFLTKLSPFHGSFFITSMGSLGIPPVTHHLYDFGNVPIFCSYGAKRTVYELNRQGKPVEKKYIDYTFNTDERICDGHYFASALKMFKEIMKNPEQLSQPPEKIVEDIP